MTRFIRSWWDIGDALQTFSATPRPVRFVVVVECDSCVMCYVCRQSGRQSPSSPNNATGPVSVYQDDLFYPLKPLIHIRSSIDQ